jgi:hypothetical protein
MHRLFLAVIVSGFLLLITAAGLLVVSTETRPHTEPVLVMD